MQLPHPELTTAKVRKSLQDLGSSEKASFLKGFFKTGPGEYGAGDRFIGVSVPDVRKVVKDFRELAPVAVLPLLRSPIHEERLFALLRLVAAYEKGTTDTKAEIFCLYLDNIAYINNWDLVDCSAPRIVGDFLLERDRAPLCSLAESDSLWERRIAVMATFQFIRKGQFADTLEIARLLLGDREDLIHKAVGWMLREVGKRDLPSEEGFLRKHCREMPRTMLRYAIEHLPQEKRRAFLAGDI